MKEKTSTVGSIVAAIFASICCIGPLVLVALGLSGAGWIPAFAKFRPLFIAVAILFLGRGWWVVLKKGKCCEVETANSKSVRKDKIILSVITIVVILIVMFPYLLGMM